MDIKRLHLKNKNRYLGSVLKFMFVFPQFWFTSFLEGMNSLSNLKGKN